MDRNHLVRILTINGLTLESSEEEMRMLLQRARYSPKELAIALQVLREPVGNRGVSEGEVGRIFVSDEVLNATEIATLLGMEVTSKKQNFANESFLVREFTILHQLFIVILALLLALVGILGLMYAFGYGIFHPTSAMNFL